jgi:hypothetical protein
MGLDVCGGVHLLLPLLLLLGIVGHTFPHLAVLIYRPMVRDLQLLIGETTHSRQLGTKALRMSHTIRWNRLIG